MNEKRGREWTFATAGACDVNPRPGTSFVEVEGSQSERWPLDAGSQTIRRVDSVTGATTTYAGGFNRLRVDGTLATAGFPGPGQLNIAPDGSLWVDDGGYLRHIALDGTVTTLQGVSSVRTFAIDTDGTIYIGTIGGLYSVPSVATSGAVTPTLLIAAGTQLSVSPATPATGTTIAAFALLGHKQIVMIAQSRLVVATLP